MDRFKLDPVKLDENWKKRRAELMAELEELKAELKEERSLPGVNKLSLECPLSSLSMARLSEISKKQNAALREEYKNREPLILDLRRRCNSQEDPCCTAASPPGVITLPAFAEDGEGKEA